MKINIDDNTVKYLLEDARIDNIEVIVVGAIIYDKGKVLLLKRAASESFLPGYVELPSGKLEKGETIFEGLSREVKEETGLSIKSVDSYINKFDYTSGSLKKSRQLNFFINTFKNDIILTPEEHSDFYWVKIGSPEYLHLNISEKNRDVLKDIKIEDI